MLLFDFGGPTYYELMAEEIVRGFEDEIEGYLYSRFGD